MEWLTVPVEKPDDLNVILGQSHFIKTVEDIHEVLAGASPQLRFGIAFCESSGPRLVRRSGNDDELVHLATRNAQVADRRQLLRTIGYSSERAAGAKTRRPAGPPAWLDVGTFAPCDRQPSGRR
jgi:adenosine/AMP kinase